MASALLLAAFLSLPTQAKPALAFQPHFAVRFQPRALAVWRNADEREVVCGLTVIHKTPAADPQILMPPRDTGSAVRRIEPRGCSAATAVTAR